MLLYRHKRGSALTLQVVDNIKCPQQAKTSNDCGPAVVCFARMIYAKAETLVNEPQIHAVFNHDSFDGPRVYRKERADVNNDFDSLVEGPLSSTKKALPAPGNYPPAPKITPKANGIQLETSQKPAPKKVTAPEKVAATTKKRLRQPKTAGTKKPTIAKKKKKKKP
jgi:hypothetical protein